MTNGEVVSLLSMRLCGYREAARALGVPASTLWRWLEGREAEGLEPVLRTTPTHEDVMTWGEFVEAAYLRECRRRRMPLRRLRLFIEALRDELQLPHPLATKRPFIAVERRLVLDLEERVELAGEYRPVVVDPTDGQLVLGYPAEALLDKVEFADVGDMPAVRWFPAGKQSPVLVDPEMRGGAPTVRGIRTEALAELASDGMSVAVLAEDYGLPEDELRQALAYEWDTSHRQAA
jgi:uncharacterized protein (DUF433 family)